MTSREANFVKTISIHQQNATTTTTILRLQQEMMKSYIYIGDGLVVTHRFVGSYTSIFGTNHRENAFQLNISL